MRSKNLKAKILEAETSQYSVLLHGEDAEEMGVYPGDRVEIITDSASLVAVVDISRSLVEEGRIGVFTKASDFLGLQGDEGLEVRPSSPPRSISTIQKMMGGKELNSEEIHEIVLDIVKGRLTPSEMTAFLVSQEINGMSIEETAYLTKSMVETGEILELEEEPIVDVHSIGGIPGNKYSLITVPIVAAAGLAIPKTSSRAITSPAGTPDIMEIMAEVSLSMEEISEIVSEVGGVLAWGGAVNLAPADDLLVQIERPLGIDPKSQLLASILSKKLSVRADRILIDIPTGLGAKIESSENARDLANDFMSLGHELGVEVDTALTYGGQPLGYLVGPGLEAREALNTLRGEGPNSLIEKSTELAGALLEMGGFAARGEGCSMARSILESGKAEEKFREIIDAQGGNPDVRVDDLPLGDKTETLTANKGGYVKRIFNSCIKDIARAAGAPRDKGAGVKLFYKEGQEVDEGDVIMEIFSEHESKLDDAVYFAKKNSPFKIEGMLLERISRRPRGDRS